VKGFVRYAAPALVGVVITAVAPCVAAQEQTLRVGYAEVLSLARAPPEPRGRRGRAARRRHAKRRRRPRRPWLQENPALGFVAGPALPHDRPGDRRVRHARRPARGLRRARPAGSTRPKGRSRATRRSATTRRGGRSSASPRRLLRAPSTRPRWREAAEAQVAARRPTSSASPRPAGARARPGTSTSSPPGSNSRAPAGRSPPPEAGVAAADAALRVALGLDPGQAFSLAGALDDVRARYARDRPSGRRRSCAPDLRAAELALTATRAEVALEARRRTGRSRRFN
jgi:hypothetical protein